MGWRFTPNFSAEVGFADLGTTAAFFADGVRMNLSVGGPTMAFIGSLPFDSWESYLKAGYLYTNANLSINGGSSLGSGASNDSFAPFFGVGVLYAFDNHWYTRLEFDHYQSISYDIRDAAETINLNVGTVGIGFRF